MTEFQIQTPTVSQAAGAAEPKRTISKKLTATSFQYECILAMLASGPKHTYEFRRAGIAHPAMRTKELREKYGYPIETAELISTIDEFGFPHSGVAVYALTQKHDAPAAGGVH